ncbi:hypothetical protein AGABI2DRAFT_79322 [Agaricus bisporus var. bisporus H97]|uniref:hypothetical protein n=1 Tax=Agaricus bisporus var. bisporus (strain H97 / ATCC MYA-4626 / FGSC 10389) TaxID=936046 RepID=UPI00029F5CA9|nr:hypothetical protein AGABI2DRAFT_79322 [Agaricus bisporus var. bisporus H97]EKV42077.1 hypothetical protein AGABI2DRAFT_79322 [Agaricus bisporus var. bisporus H97]
MVRSSRSPHHRARANAMAARSVTKSAITIANPNKPPPEVNGISGDSSPSSVHTHAEGSPNNHHPSVTAHVAPISLTPRPFSLRPPENNWTSLDMGGVNIKNLPSSSGLFSFTFLVTLYLNHNALSSIPPEIAKLRHLELLDLSGNNLTSLPPELGMLTQLKELYVFDNHLSTLPPEVGSLHHLQTFGVEGNPLDATLKSLVQKDGTPALISYLRDTGPVPAPPPERTWKYLLSQVEQQALMSDPNSENISVLSYNILCEKYATERLYGYTPAWALLWDYRKELILNELLASDADFLCVQEMDVAQYEEYFSKHLSRDYTGVYSPKSRAKTMDNEQERRFVDGCAIFYKTSRFQLVEKQLIEFSAVAMQRQDFKKTDDMFNRVLGKDHIAVVCLMEDKQTGTRFIIANTHIHSHPAYRDVKLVQVALLVEEVEKIANNFSRLPPRPPQQHSDGGSSPPPTRPPPAYSDGTKIPLIIAGDFNSIPQSGVYEFLNNGTLAADHPDFMSHTYGRYTSEGPRHRLGLKSANSSLGVGEPLTNHTPPFQGTIDYIWYSTANLGVNAVLGEVDKAYLEKVVGFPNAHFPSDHICQIAEFRVKHPKDQAPRTPSL